MARAIRARADRRVQQFPGELSEARSSDWQRRILALETLRAVQSLTYCKNPPNEEWMQVGDYTIDHCGDCKALSILFVALSKLLGLQAETYWITQTGQEINHVTARVWLEGYPFWADGSIRGAMLGESPYEAEPRLASGVLRPASAPRGEPQRGWDGTNVFRWNGWDALWPGWPGWWFCSNYPYFCATYSQTLAQPVRYGFYQNALAV